MYKIASIAFCLILFVGLVGCKNKQLIEADRQENARINKLVSNYLIYDSSYDEGYLKSDMQILETWGVLCPIELIKLGNSKESHGDIGGSFLGFSGNVQTYNAVKFCWKNEGNLYFSTIPISKIIISEDSENYVYATMKFDYMNRHYCGHGEMVNSTNVNNIIESSFLALVYIHVPAGKSNILVDYLMPSSLGVKEKLNGGE